jgi:Domain of unknown function (DUF4265)
MISENTKHVKVLFHLEKDEDDYPPDDWESLWAQEIGGGSYKIDNIPFFVRGISVGDIVSVKKKEEDFVFNVIEEYSSNSVIRVMLFVPTKLDELKLKMSGFGCEFESSHIKGLISFDVPPTASFSDIVEYLQFGEDQEFWSYEEASIRHPD